ncbi:MAG: pseudouridine synthase [Chitinophagales bacterium]
MKKTNKRTTTPTEKSTQRRPTTRKNNDTLENKHVPKLLKGNDNSSQVRNPNRKAERLERAKKYAKQNAANKNISSADENKTGKKEIAEIKKDRQPGKKPFHSKFSEPQRYGKSKKEIKREIKSSYEKEFGKRERFSKKESFRDKQENKKLNQGAEEFGDENKARPGKSKFIKNLQKFSNKKKGKTASFNKTVAASSSISKPTPLSKEGTRLNKYLANSGVAARRKCDELISQGLVSVNGKVVMEMGYKIMPGDKVTFKNKLVKPVNYVYILLNKPKDYLTTVDDDKGRNTVMELISNATDERVYPVGRLDRNTTGLLLLTNDGDLAQKLSHPSFGANKLYEVELDKPVTAADLQKITDGVELEDGIAMVDGIDYAHHTKRNIVGISLHIGKNRIVRRIFEQLGYHVERLDRTLYAGLTKRDLPRGRWRYLTEREIIKLKYLK